MTRQEASERYQIPMEILEEYERWNLCGEKDGKTGGWQYGDMDLDRLRLIMTLHNSSFEKEEIEHYMRLHLRGEATAAERMRILNQKRKRILDEIHIQEGQLEQLDYLRYKIQKNMGNQGN
ncbi:MAG: MerR family transcriptional regulator [Lachnospiraceae bacterium]